jgi:SRSO17 transposase
MGGTDLLATVTRLQEFAAQYQPLFGRREQREHAAKYLEGLLSSLQRKSIEPIALQRNDNVRCLQHFVGSGGWDDDPILRHHQKHVTQTLGEEGGILVVDGKGFPKQGNHSVGVKRQYCGRLGKEANCQVGEFLAYRTSRGHTLIDRRLYLPEDWAQDAGRRLKCHVPPEVEFRKGWELALEMIERAQVPYEWITGDERYGDVPEFMDRLDAQGKRYIFEIPRDSRYWVDPPRFRQRRRSVRGIAPTRPQLRQDSPLALRAEDVVGLVKPKTWRRMRIRDGEKGPIEVEATYLRAQCVRDRLPGREVWLVITRTLDEKRQYKYFESNARPHISLTALLRAGYSRWPIEQCFEQANQEAGLAHYENRSWAGWHHHMTLVMLAHHFLVIERLRLGEKTRRDDGGRSGLDSQIPSQHQPTANGGTARAA